jgi:uncharacterized protein (TIGR02453 family)
MEYFSPAYIDFFSQLALNNNKEWFNKHKEIYNLAVDQPFKVFINDLINEIRIHDTEINIAPTDAIFRINRDMRFAKGLPPYKLNRSALISTIGRKSKSVPGFYLEIGSQHLKFGGGVYKLSLTAVKKIKNNIDRIPVNDSFKKLFKNYDFSADHMHFTYEAVLNADVITSERFLQIVMAYWKASHDINKVLAQYIQ